MPCVVVSGLAFALPVISFRQKAFTSFTHWQQLLALLVGGIQSLLSRSTYSKLMPETKDTASFFSFFDVTEKIAIVIGMFSFGYITELTGSQRSSVLALVIFFIAGLIGLFFTLNSQKNFPDSL